MHIRTIDNNHLEITGTEFKASILMNPRDAMVFAQVKQVSQDEKKQTQQLAEFSQFLKEQVGGKILCQLPAEVKSDVFPLIKTTAPNKFISKQSFQTLSNRLSPDSEKQIQTNRSKLDDSQSGLLAVKLPQEYKGLEEKLFAFKRDNAHFVTLAKIEQGLYSAEAESLKIHNKHVVHFAIYNHRSGEFIATLQLFIHGEIAYLSDLIVHENHRNQRWAETLILLAGEEITICFSHLIGAWFIAGGDGLTTIGDKLYGHLLQSEDLTETLQLRLGLRTIFGAPQRLLLEAMHRNIESPFQTLDTTPLSDVADLIMHSVFGGNNSDKNKQAVQHVVEYLDDFSLNRLR